jgi:YesN/AraC family two-component response regulator
VLRTLIVEDEKPARERLKNLLSGNESVEVIGEAGDGIQAVEMIEEKHPDLVLLDIQMPRLDGFGIFNSVILDKPLSIPAKILR